VSETPIGAMLDVWASDPTAFDELLHHPDAVARRFALSEVDARALRGADRLSPAAPRRRRRAALPPPARASGITFETGSTITGSALTFETGSTITASALTFETGSTITGSVGPP